MSLSREPLVILATFEIRQHSLVRPSFAAKFDPVVIVFRTATHVDHGVYRATTAQHTTLHHNGGLVVLMFLRLQGVTTQQVAFGRFEVGNRHVDVWVPITGTLFEQSYRGVGILG
ncbi:hypothetical protein D3C86_1707050 [compost metagenome]